MTDRYAVVGNPVTHSKSPLIHSTFARETGEDIAYEKLEAPIGRFSATVDAFRAAGGRGINITAPFKLDAYAYATDCMERARHAGASNCLKFAGDRVYAENFDGIGLVHDVERNLGFAIEGRRVLMLGAGGAVRGALGSFVEQRPALVVVANRDVAKAKKLAEELSVDNNTLVAGGYGDIGTQAFDIVLNGTSASMDTQLPPIPASAFARDCLAYDLVYGKGLTPFLRLARSAGASHLADGVGMLVEPAAEAFAWWRGVRPQTKSMIESLTVPLV